MEHFAILAPPFPSHVRALEALAGQLIDTGHAVTWIHQADVQQFLTDQRIKFVSVGAQSHPAGSLQKMLRRAASPNGVFGLRRVIADVAANTAMLCNEVPAVIQSLSITVVIADQMEAAGGLIAQGLQLPFVSVACALPVNREPAHPLPVMPWLFATDKKSLNLYKASAGIYDWLMKPHARVISTCAKRFGLAPKQTLADCLSPLAQISQTTVNFDFPRANLPINFFHVGPMRSNIGQSFAPTVLVNPQRPFVFASLGTLQGGRIGLFLKIARACQALDFQLLIAHCDLLDAEQEQSLKRAGATWVTGFANQQAVVQMADVVVTHGGLNTALDALAANTPLLVLPIAFDQPGVAARVVYCGAGLTLAAKGATVSTIAVALQRLVIEPAFAQNAKRVGQSVAPAGGAAAAARIVLSSIGRSSVPEPVAAFSRPNQHQESVAYAA